MDLYLCVSEDSDGAECGLTEYGDHKLHSTDRRPCQEAG